MSKAISTPTDEMLILAEALGEIKGKTDKLESEFLTQAKPLEAATTALTAALAGIKSLQFHVLDNNLGVLSARVEQYRQAISEQVEIITAELKKADAENATKAGTEAETLRGEIAKLQTQIGQLTTQFGAQLDRVQLEAEKKAKEFAAIPGPMGKPGRSMQGAGQYEPKRTYSAGEIVSFLGGSFLSNIDGNSEKPSSRAKNWTQLVSRAAGGAPPLESMGGTLQITQGGTGQASASAGARALLNGIGSTQGQVLYHNGTQWEVLSPGASGTFLKSLGTGANPDWAAIANASAATNLEAATATSTTTFTTPANAALAALRVANTKTPRPGVAFDGTANAKATSTLINQAITTDPFSVTIGFSVPSSDPSATRGIFAVSSASTGTAAYGFDGAINTSGALTIIIRGAAITDYRQYAVANFVSTYANKVVQLCVVRPTSGDVVIYINGAVVTATETTGGTPPANWQATVTSTYFTYGTSYSGQEFVGTITNATFWNLSLSAADCLEIAESGGAVPFRFQFGSQVGLITGNDSTFASDTGNWVLTATTATISGGKLNQPNGQQVYYNPHTLAIGKRYRTSLTVDSLTAGSLQYYDGASYITYGSSPASYSLEFTALGAANFYLRPQGGNSVIDNVTMVRIGAICHFALDEGIGYQLHDASTNKLDSVMTTTGISHLVAKREGYVRTPSTGISWSGSHEPKNILGAASTQRMLPNDAVVTQIVLKASGASTNGASVNSTNTAARWSAVAALSTTKSVRTVANSGLPAATADADTDILVDPDTVNYTGTIQADVRFCVAEG